MDTTSPVLAEHDHAFRCMATDCRVLVGHEAGDERTAAAQAEQAERLVRRVASTLSRFDSQSELSTLNADPRAAVPASRLLCLAVRAGLWAAELTDGLVDPTVLRALEDAGYRASRQDVPPASLPLALAAAPARSPARPHPAASGRREIGRAHV